MRILLQLSFFLITLTGLHVHAQTKQKASSTKKATITKPQQSDIPFFTDNPPTYYAILIAATDYDDDSFTDLQNPVKDANELKSILESRYSFDADNIDILSNRNREDILDALSQRCNAITANDNLLIVFAGHAMAEKDRFGVIDGYWIPVSAKKGLTATYISAEDINKALKRTNAKQVLIVADARFSPDLTSALPKEETKDIVEQYKSPGRKVMSSGSMAPLPDKDRFFINLRKALNDNTDKYLLAKKLFNSLNKTVPPNPKAPPQYAAIKNVGDEGGEFVFIKK